MTTTMNRQYRTVEQAVADQIDCDLDNIERRCLNQSMRAPPEVWSHWQKLANQIGLLRNEVRKRMHELDKEATI